jgi:hypothetical protein
VSKLLLLCLLCTPDNVSRAEFSLYQPRDAPALYPELASVIRQIAIRDEYVDSREERYLLNLEDNFEPDLKLIRVRVEELKTAPPLSDSERIGPDREKCNELCVENRQFRKYLEDKIPWEQDRASLYREVMQECDECYRSWDQLRDAKCSFYYVQQRRRSLMKLREALGRERYILGDMPDHVPNWR